MKPQSQISRQFGSHLRHPVTDFHYQATGADFRVANDRVQHSPPSFRDLSSEFLAGEMKRDYLKEAFCFVILVSVSAWPIVSMVRALSLLK
jgi:hypothetical protein